MTSTAPLEATGLTVAYRQDIALDAVDVCIPDGAVSVLLGPNGAGKSTLLKAAMGLLPIRGGQVRFFGSPLEAMRTRIGYMPQAAEVDWSFPTTVRDVVTMGLYGRLGWFRRPGAAERRRVGEALEKVGLAELAARHISQLSGGQKQRTFLARTLVQDPELLLLDEPLAGVDVASRHDIMAILDAIRAEGRTIVMVHHDLSSVTGFADHAVILSNGAVVAQGPVEQAFIPATIMQAYGVGDLEWSVQR